MLKREIKYTDFDDKEQVETAYFNLTKSELVEMEVEYSDGLQEAVRRIINAKDNKALVAEFKRVILAAYGQKSADGKRFVKSQELRDEFAQTAAYDALFIELATSDQKAAAFIKGILPSDMGASIDTLPPPNIRPAEQISDEKAWQSPEQPAIES